jgi:putative ABC transport system permease protein
MKFVPIVWRNLMRRKIRTIFTVASIFIAFVLFALLMALLDLYSEEYGATSDE